MVVVEPVDNDEGGNIKTAVLMSVAPPGGDVGSSALLESGLDDSGVDGFVKKDIGLSMMATHLAREECTPTPSATVAP